VSIINIAKIRDRGNIKVYNSCKSPVSFKGASKEVMFDGAKDGISVMIPLSFIDIEYANSKNTDLFVSGILTFEESERDEIYVALGFPNWKERFWDEEIIEDALMYPTVAKMNRILAVRDVLTIERIRGKMLYLINTSIRKPIDNVIVLVNGRWQELLRGRKISGISVMLPEEREDKEKQRLKTQNETLENELKAMKEQIAMLMAAKGVSPAPAEPAPEKKAPGRPPKKSD
jgi:hypothetical protein